MASKFAQHADRSESNTYNNEVLRIVLVGKTGAGKSATGNTILGKESFESKFSAKSLTLNCSNAFSEVDGQRVKVIDTPGLFDTKFEEEITRKNVAQSISYAAPGPHVFLVVIRLGRFTDEEKQTVQKIREIFGEQADRYSMVLFTHGDQLEDQTIEEFLKECEDLKELVARCNGQCHVFNNKEKNRSQVRELLDKIRNITEKNGGSHYTTEMFQKAERAIEEEKQRILKEREGEIRKQEEKYKMILDQKYEEQLKQINEDRERSDMQMEAYEREMEEELRRIREEEEKQIEAHEIEMEEERRRIREEEEKQIEAHEMEMKEERRIREQERQKADSEREMEEEKQKEAHEMEIEEEMRIREEQERLREANKRNIEEERRRIREEQERLKAALEREMEKERRRIGEEEERLKAAREREMEKERKIREEDKRLRGDSQREMDEVRSRMREEQERLRDGRKREMEEERRRMREAEERIKAARKREMEEESRRIREEEDRKARKEAEDSPSTFDIIVFFVKKVFTSWFGKKGKK